jgi:hypothetical protein
MKKKDLQEAQSRQQKPTQTSQQSQITFVENHIIDWEESKVVAGESDHFTRWIREAVAIRKTGNKAGNKAVNRDIGTYNLSHTYDSLLSAESSSGNSRLMVRRRQQMLLKRHT